MDGWMDGWMDGRMARYKTLFNHGNFDQNCNTSTMHFCSFEKA